MTLKYLLDENVDKVYKRQFVQRNPTLIMWVVGDPGAPPRGTLDPEILRWCEEHNFLLVTNRTSIPGHLAEHVAQERHTPGIFILNDKLTIGQTIDELILIAQAPFNDEYQNQIVHLPLL
ncbi:hypothetical protein FNW02_16110 [Komarekiella sp. 'clone 1']|uniref:DUF5615 domain-containing protein n=1 Tax=Komarekiella delphini-convector SJRDD-AB1 TaxID=2593771 RepID=A0AA40VRK8_9NOST|nr:DUF5615 family PIN-like protein [Komarekiella delphini-convector]MBD6617309.1 hypothetical protein [Komarekiella delphini-convector SJRDD-AB1]